MAEGITTAPDITGVIDQQFFIEPEGGAQHPVSYLDHFPETLYTKSLNSNLVALMYALLGPTGVASLQQNYLEARLDIENSGLRTTDLDQLYANPFAFARLATEEYQVNTDGLLNNAAWTKVQASDAEYRNRAENYLKGLRAGGTLLGVTLVAKSGLARAVEVIENYKALYDKFSDNPLGLEKRGVTNSTEEIILLPRQELPRSAVQTLTVTNNPISGEFSLVLPIGPGRNLTEQNHTRTRKLPYNVTFNELRTALEELTVVGTNNVRVQGGPFPGNALQVTFTGQLADSPIPLLLAPSKENSLGGPEGQHCELHVVSSIAGVSADGETATIPPENFYYAQTALNNVKPVTTIVSAGKAPGVTKRQIANSAIADSEFVEVLRYVTGSRAIQWPPVDATHWIESGVEHEAPVTQTGQTINYTNFHRISAALAYTEKALESPHYEDEKWLEVQPNFNDVHVGEFSAFQTILFNFLAEYKSPLQEFLASNAPATPPEFLSYRGEGFIAGHYPEGYVRLAAPLEAELYHSLEGSSLSRRNITPTLADQSTFETNPIWASLERPTGTDYLEIDLGRPQAINTLIFDVSNKPYDISLAYDLLDQSPARRFKAVTFSDPRNAESVLSVGHNIEAPNPWRLIELNFTNNLEQMIYTRFIRLEFKKRTGEKSPFTTTNIHSGQEERLPFSVEVKNLRIGRSAP